jgi:hypothetical protein
MVSVWTSLSTNTNLYWNTDPNAQPNNPGATGSNFSLYPKVYFSFLEEKNTKLSLPLEWHREW